MAAPLKKCPRCESESSLATLEQIYGLAGCSAISADGPDWGGETEVLYDTSTTVGVSCQECGWEYEGADWLNQLS